MDERPLFRYKVAELRGIASTGRAEDVARVLSELAHRNTPSAVTLRQELLIRHGGPGSEPEVSAPANQQPTPQTGPGLVPLPAAPAANPPGDIPQSEPEIGVPATASPNASAPSGPRVSAQAQPSASADSTPPGIPLPEVLPAGIPPTQSAEALGFGDEFEVHSTDQVVDRSIRLFRFLSEAMHARHEPVRLYEGHAWSCPLSGIPPHSSLRVGTVVSVHDEGLVLEVTRPGGNPRPPVPEALRPWLATSLDDPSVEPSPWAELTVGSRIQRFEDDQARVAAFDGFLRHWASWSERENRDAPVRQLYDDLMRLRSLMEGQNERYELVVADGLLNWDAPFGKICHPLIARRIDISADTLQQRVRLVDTAQPTTPLFGCLRGQSLIPGPSLAAAQAEVRGNDLHPLAPNATALLLGIRNRWIGATSLPGRPSITRYPLVLLIDAVEKASPMLDGIISDLMHEAARDPERARTDLPPALRTIVGDADVGASATEDEKEQAVAGTDPDDPAQRILFTKPANVEQARIVAHLRRRPSVVVLGPPGTGKTHTIANLIGHFLAEGKTILVTSETAKALGEVRNKVVPRLQPLCLPLLSSDEESRNELEKCVNGIADRLHALPRPRYQSRREGSMLRDVPSPSNYRTFDAEYWTCTYRK